MREGMAQKVAEIARQDAEKKANRRARRAGGAAVGTGGAAVGTGGAAAAAAAKVAASTSTSTSTSTSVSSGADKFKEEWQAKKKKREDEQERKAEQARARREARRGGVAAVPPVVSPVASTKTATATSNIGGARGSSAGRASESGADTATEWAARTKARVDAKAQRAMAAKQRREQRGLKAKAVEAEDAAEDARKLAALRQRVLEDAANDDGNGYVSGQEGDMCDDDEEEEEEEGSSDEDKEGGIYATIDTGNLRMAVAKPPGVGESEWIAMNTSDFCNDLFILCNLIGDAWNPAANQPPQVRGDSSSLHTHTPPFSPPPPPQPHLPTLLHLSSSQPLTPHLTTSIPTTLPSSHSPLTPQLTLPPLLQVRGEGFPQGFEYRWADGVLVKTPIRCTPSEYVTFVLEWVEVQLADESLFPEGTTRQASASSGLYEGGSLYGRRRSNSNSRSGRDSKPGSPSQFKPRINKVLTRLFRVYAIVYNNQLGTLSAMNAVKHLNTCFKVSGLQV
jgi:hypothetical protein